MLMKKNIKGYIKPNICQKIYSTKTFSISDGKIIFMASQSFYSVSISCLSPSKLQYSIKFGGTVPYIMHSTQTYLTMPHRI
jgi:hypothetical protein